MKKMQWIRNERWKFELSPRVRSLPICTERVRSWRTKRVSSRTQFFLYIILHYTRQPCEFGHVVKNTTGWKTPAHIFHFLSEENFIYDASFLIFYIPVSSDLPTLRHKRRTIDNHGGLSYLCYQIIVYIILELI